MVVEEEMILTDLAVILMVVVAVTILMEGTAIHTEEEETIPMVVKVILIERALRVRTLMVIKEEHQAHMEDLVDKVIKLKMIPKVMLDPTVTELLEQAREATAVVEVKYLTVTNAKREMKNYRKPFKI